MKRFLSLLSILILAPSCSLTTHPNISVLYRVPPLNAQLPSLPDKSQPSTQEPLPAEVQALFQLLYTLDPALALEVGRLPEFQHEVGDKQVVTLGRFLELIKKATSEEKANLADLLKIGLPDFRRYCAPLQSVFWILERKKPKTNYTPREIYFWTIKEVENNIKPEIKENPLQYSLIGLLAQAWDYSEEHRWKDFKTVTDRLNSPELVDYYERSRFYYQSRGANPTDLMPHLRHLFEHNYGSCIDIADFAVYCLKKGGYKAWDLHVPSPTGRLFHSVCVFEVNGKKYVMDNGCPNPIGIIPFKEY